MPIIVNDVVKWCLALAVPWMIYGFAIIILLLWHLFVLNCSILYIYLNRSYWLVLHIKSYARYIYVIFGKIKGDWNRLLLILTQASADLFKMSFSRFIHHLAAKLKSKKVILLLNVCHLKTLFLLPAFILILFVRG